MKGKGQMINPDELIVGKKYFLNKREVVFMGMFYPHPSAQFGFNMFAREDGTVVILKKSDMLETFVKIEQV